MTDIKAFIKNFARLIGIDKSIAYSSGARIVQAFTGMASIFFVAQFLTKAEQGFYYTFGSIIAIQVFFELGLSNIITQYVAHEVSHLTWKSSSELEGDEQHHSRLAHLLRFSVKWYAFIGIIFFFVLLCAGVWFFGYYSTPTDDETVSWFIPWILVSIGTVLSLFISPLMAIIMGLDKVKEVMKMSFYQQMIIPVTTWIGLIVGFHLYVLGIASLLSVAFVVIYGFSTELKPTIHHLWKKEITEKVSYKKEIFPYQWKIALSWLSGYFIFQLFNPVLFATHGAVVAGQMGMTLAVLNGINAFASSWINTKVPLFSKLIAQDKYEELDSIFKMTLGQMISICIFLLILMLTGIYGLRVLDIPLGYRFLPFWPIIFLMIALVVNQIIGALATYLRCHKQEPFLLNSIVAGCICAISTIVLGKYFGAFGMTAGYCAITVALSFWGINIFLTCKRKWHVI